MSKFIINAGHTLTDSGSGAIGLINESKENRAVVSHVIKLLKQLGHTVIECTIDKSENYLKEAVATANKHDADLAVSIHFNAGGGTGTETLVFDSNAIPNKYAKAINKEITAAFGYTDRGIKQRPDLYWLRATTSKAILIECCFCDSKSDVAKYSPEKMAAAIVKGLVGESPSDTSDELLAVCVGAYSNKATADKVLAEVKAKGYKDAYLIKR
jgi:N-acetylmuramoyl-L-alanine amidase